MIIVHGDRFQDVWVAVDRRGPSREAPIDIFDTKATKVRAGGAGNVYEAIRSLGVAEIQDNTVPTEIKVRFTEGGKQVFRADMKDTASRPTDWYFPENAVHVIVDYDKGSVTEDLIKRIVASSPGECYVGVRSPKSMYEHLDIRKTTYFCNADEYRASSWSHPLGRKMVVTGGDRGAGVLYSYSDRAPDYGAFIPAYARYVKSVCGAGDIVMAAYIACGLKGLTTEVLRYSMCAAAIAVENEMTYVPTLGEVNARYREVVGNRDCSGERCGVLREDNGLEAGVPVQPALPRDQGRDVLRTGGDSGARIGRTYLRSYAGDVTQAGTFYSASVPQPDGFSLC